ncbi:MAG TPA: YkgJ family cysteine cluster protein [Planctomycetota bacterium]|nr:YkgJ family cysteine cluster protein [Planctomycetota bacterium]
MSVHVAPPPASKSPSRTKSRASAPEPQAPAALAPAPLLPPLPPGSARGSRRKGVPFAQSKCGSCIALCCRYFALEIDRPTVPADFENLRWYLLHERVNVFVEGRRWYVQIFNKCAALGADFKCTIYETRPAICREYDNDVCDKDEALGDSTSDQLFRSVGELEAYRDAWVVRYKAKRRRERRATALRAASKRRRAAGRRKPKTRATRARVASSR